MPVAEVESKINVLKFNVNFPLFFFMSGCPVLALQKNWKFTEYVLHTEIWLWVL